MIVMLINWETNQLSNSVMLINCENEALNNWNSVTLTHTEQLYDSLFDCLVNGCKRWIHNKNQTVPQKSDHCKFHCCWVIQQIFTRTFHPTNIQKQTLRFGRASLGTSKWTKCVNIQNWQPAQGSENRGIQLQWNLALQGT